MSWPVLASGSDFDEATIVKSKQQIEEEVTEPPRYRVILHNDDYTPMPFVVQVLQDVFQYSAVSAMALMLKVHYRGTGIVGTYPFEIAETKVMKATRMAQAAGYPLLLGMEEEPKA